MVPFISRLLSRSGVLVKERRYPWPSRVRRREQWGKRRDGEQKRKRSASAHCDCGELMRMTVSWVRPLRTIKPPGETERNSAKEHPAENTDRTSVIPITNMDAARRCPSSKSDDQPKERRPKPTAIGSARGGHPASRYCAGGHGSSGNSSGAGSTASTGADRRR